VDPNLTKTPKKDYQTPKLRLYGDLAGLTNANSNTTKNADGGVMATSKTH